MGALNGFGAFLAALAAIGCAYQLFAAIALHRFFVRARPAEARSAGVTILKPLHGDEPRLGANLATFLTQDYAGEVQMICGVRDAADPSVATVKRLSESFPDRAINLIVDPAVHGSNAKIGNLINMLPAARHDILIFSDSDMAVDRTYLATLLAALAQPDTGAVTCLYRGRGDSGFWSQLSAGVISYVAMPDMVVGYMTRLERPCLGSTIVLSRETLDATGGLVRFADVLADDHAIGAAVAELGLRVRIPPLMLVHACAEMSLAAVWRQKLRWAATIRSINPVGYTASIITRPLPLALLASAFHPLPGLAIALFALCIRIFAAINVDRIAGAPSAPLWLLPVIDCFEFLVFIAGFFVTKIDWRGSRLNMAPDGRMTA